MAQPKLLHLDIERSPVLATIWQLFDLRVGIDQLLGDSEILCCAMSWEGSDEVLFTSKWDHGRKGMLKKIHKAMSEADGVITYNGDRFDLKVLNMEFASVGLPPPSPYKSVDLLKTVKKKFRMTSNKLDYVLRYFKLGAKKQHRGHQLWLDVMNKKPDAYKEMKEYNITDVTELKKLFHFLLGWGVVGLPNASAFAREAVCPECGGNHYQKRGAKLVNMLRYQQYQCNDCGHWFRDRMPIKEDKAQIMVGVK